MKIFSDSFAAGERIPAQNAFGKHDSESHVALCPNKSPHIGCSDVPVETKSLVLICHDSDVPSSPENVNKEGVTVPKDLPRVDFYHWVQVDLSPDAFPLAEGQFSEAVTPRGKPGPEGPHGSRAGLNNYVQWFEGDPDMAGDYFSYDGPCPPWNDELLHHYHFTLYALDIERCPVDGKFGGPEVLKGIEGHILAQASLTGSYAINPDV